MTSAWEEYSRKIAGGWKCVTYEMFDNTGEERKLIAKPHGETPLGRVLISPNGWLAAHLARPDRMQKARSGQPWQTAPDQDLAYVGRGLSMYCGYMKLFKDDNGGLYWQTKVEVSTDPNRMGGIEERKVALFEENGKSYMILEPKQDMLLDVCQHCLCLCKRPDSALGRYEDKSCFEVGEVRVSYVCTFMFGHFTQ